MQDCFSEQNNAVVGHRFGCMKSALSHPEGSASSGDESDSDRASCSPVLLQQ